MYAVDQLHKLHVYVSADVFGESSWGYVTAMVNIGQLLVMLLMLLVLCHIQIILKEIKLIGKILIKQC